VARGVWETLFWDVQQRTLIDTFRIETQREFYWPTVRVSPDFKFLVYTVPPEGDHTALGKLAVALNPYAPANRGDLDLNHTTDVADAVRALRFVVGLDAPAPDERFRADVNDSGEVTVSDVVLILRSAVGLE
jgi:hypothetical protein